MPDLSSQISALEAQLADLRCQKTIQDQEALRRTPEQNLAIELHDALCTQNHTDGCGWHYEIQKGVHNWSGSEHAHWLGKATKFQGFCHTRQMSITAAIELLKFTKAI